MSLNSFVLCWKLLTLKLTVSDIQGLFLDCYRDHVVTLFVVESVFKTLRIVHVPS